MYEKRYSETARLCGQNLLEGVGNCPKVTWLCFLRWKYTIEWSWRGKCKFFLAYARSSFWNKRTTLNVLTSTFRYEKKKFSIGATMPNKLIIWGSKRISVLLMVGTINSEIEKCRRHFWFWKNTLFTFLSLTKKSVKGDGLHHTCREVKLIPRKLLIFY